MINEDGSGTVGCVSWRETAEWRNAHRTGRIPWWDRSHVDYLTLERSIVHQDEANDDPNKHESYDVRLVQ